MVALQHPDEFRRSFPLTVAEARADVDRLRAELPDTLLAKRPEEIRRLARHALDAEKAALRRRSKVGAEPEYDAAGADDALAAFRSVQDARRGVRDAGRDSMRWLTIGNAWGVAGIGVAGALVMRVGLEPMSTPVYGAVIAGATGPLATMMLGLTRRSVAERRLAVARASWSSALVKTGAETMGQLGGRRLAWLGWQRRQQEADAAVAVARDARAAWHRVAGPLHHPREAPTLIAKVAVLRAAQLELLRALLEQQARVVDVRPFDVAWAPDPAPRRRFGLRLWTR